MKISCAILSISVQKVRKVIKVTSEFNVYENIWPLVTEQEKCMNIM